MEEEVESEVVATSATANSDLFVGYPLTGYAPPPSPAQDMDYDLLYSEEIDETSTAVGGESSAAAASTLAMEDSLKLFRGKNKRTVAAVSAADRSAALSAMEELRGRGATTEDLVCRLCGPPRPFTAYSTLLTHYRKMWLGGIWFVGTRYPVRYLDVILRYVYGTVGGTYHLST